MWPVIIVFVLVLGYLYIDSDIESKHKFKKAQGWSAYFMVALKGSEFLLYGFFVTIITQLLFLYIPMWVLNGIVSFFSEHEFTFADDINNFRFKTISFFSWNVVFFTFIAAALESSEAKNIKLNPKLRQKAILEICKKDSIKKLKLEALEKKLLIMVTLKSRKVYVGQVDLEKITNVDTHSDEFISIIPVLSGYRNSETLEFVQTKDYSVIYNKHNITAESSEEQKLSWQQFRHIINVSEIECMSLFDVNIYETFKNQAYNLNDK